MQWLRKEGEKKGVWCAYTKLVLYEDFNRKKDYVYKKKDSNG